MDYEHKSISDPSGYAYNVARVQPEMIQLGRVAEVQPAQGPNDIPASPSSSRVSI